MALKEQKVESLVLSDAEAQSLLEHMEAAPKLTEQERLERQRQLIENASKVDLYSSDRPA